MAADLDQGKPIWLNVTDTEPLAAVGRVITHWAFLEALVEDLIAGFLGATVERVYTLTANINISTRLPAVLALAQMRLSVSDFDYFEKLIERIRKLVPFRNKIVHGLWAETETEHAQVSIIKSAGKLKYQTEYISAVYLEWLDGQVHDESVYLMRFGQQFGLIKNS